MISIAASQFDIIALITEACLTVSVARVTFGGGSKQSYD